MSAASISACSERLVDQLQSLTEVAETLTLRLLELEDRLAAQERQLQPLLQGGQGSDSDADAFEETESRLAETEERLERLEALLNAPPTSAELGDRRQLHCLQGPLGLAEAPASESQPEQQSEQQEAFDPFPVEEIDPPFLDELELRQA
ncbi:MAG: hypothetical protein R6W06_15130 [Prochlorococcaceae cyanobacterium]